MKKLHSLFILSILALTMFVGCQMNTDDADSNFTAEELEYTITVDAPHGTVELDKTKAKAGETVELTITPDSGYVLDSLSVKTSDTEITTTISDDKTSATFTMPKGNVSVEASFKTATATPTTPTVDADEATYGFTKTVDYTVVANGQSLPGTKNGAELIAIAKAKNLVKDTDYTIDGTTATLTASGVEKYLGQMTEKYSLAVNASDLYAITGGGMKEAGKTVSLSITHYDGTDWVTPKAEELYLVKVHIKEGETELTDIPVTVEGHKITFTMPDKNINVFAEFCDIKYQSWEAGLVYEARIGNRSDNEVMAVLCFNKNVYDNLKPFDGKYVLEMGNLENGEGMCFTKLCDKYKLSKDGTLNDNQYTFGVIDNNELKILNTFANAFTYNPNPFVIGSN